MKKRIFAGWLSLILAVASIAPAEVRAAQETGGISEEAAEEEAVFEEAESPAEAEGDSAAETLEEEAAPEDEDTDASNEQQTPEGSGDEEYTEPEDSGSDDADGGAQNAAPEEDEAGEAQDAAPEEDEAGEMQDTVLEEGETGEAVFLTGEEMPAAYASVFSSSGNMLTAVYTVAYKQTWARSILDKVNAFRTGNSAWYWNSDNTTKTDLTGTLSELEWDDSLEATAMKRAAELAIAYSHTRPDGGSCFTAFSSGFRSMGENIAVGYTSAAAVFSGWKEDAENYDRQGHRRNMLNTGFNRIGIGCVYYNGTYYWAMDLGYSAAGTAEAAAVDGSKSVQVEVAESQLKSFSAGSPGSCNVTYGETVDAPRLSAKISTADTWGGTVSCRIIPVWSVDDPELAGISEDGMTITGLKAGETKLTAAIYGKSFSPALKVNPVTLEEDFVELKPDSYLATGSAITPKPAVTWKETALTEGTDYALSYKNNESIGTAAVTVTGKGNFTGSVTKEFTIHCDHDYQDHECTKCHLLEPQASDFTFHAPVYLRYAAAEKEAELSADAEGMGRITLAYYDAAGNMLSGLPVDAGIYTVKADVEDGEKYGYTKAALSDASWTFTIEKARLTIAAKDITIEQDAEEISFSYTADGFLGNDEETCEVIVSYSCGAVKNETTGLYPVGLYPITPAVAAEPANYTVVYEPGTLIVGEDLVSCRVAFHDSLSGNDLISIVSMGCTVEKPEDPEADGYAFRGWYRDETLASLWDFDSDVVTGDMTLYAGWTAAAERQILIQEIPAVSYSGSALKPTVRVYDKESGTLLSSKTDYTIQYYNNVDVDRSDVSGGEMKDGVNKLLPYVAVAGKGNYAGAAAYQNFSIKPVSIEGTGFTINVSEQLTVSEKAQNVLDTFKRGRTALKEDTEYTATLTSEEGEVIPGSVLRGNAAGSYTLTIKGIGNYTGETVRDIYVADKDHLMKNAVITLGADAKKKEYTGKSILLTPSTADDRDVFTVKIGNTFLKYGTDYTVEYKNNRAIGTATLTVNGCGQYLGTQSTTFQIVGNTFSAGTITVSGLEGSMTYTGSAVRQNGVTLTEKKTGDPLTYGTDYRIVYKNNIKVGKATMTFEALSSSGYVGSFAKTFKITAAPLSADMLSGADSLTASFVPGGAKPELSLSYRGRALSEGSDYTVSYTDNKKLGTAGLTIKGKGNFSGKIADVSFMVTALNMDENKDQFTISVKPAAYSGLPLEPAVTVKYQKTALKKDIDYTVAYEGNTEAGDEAAVTIKGLGLYSGELKQYFSISPQSITKAKMTAAISDKTYSGSGQGISGNDTLTLKYNGKPLVENKDYEIGYINNINAGTASLVIAGKGNFTGMMTKTFKITPADISDASVKLTVDEKELAEGAEVPYIAQPIKPAAVVVFDGKALEEDTDYTVSYKNNKNAGSNAVVTVKGRGNYAGSLVRKFTIVAAVRTSISKAVLSLEKSSFEYTGSEIKPVVTVSLEGKPLTEGTEYTVSYKANENKGKGTVTATGIGEYMGTLTKTFTITAKAITEANLTVTGLDNLVYNGKTQKPELTVQADGRMLSSSDYAASYSNNKKAGSAAKLTITGRGNYSGKVTKTFVIQALNLADAKVEVADLAYSATKSGKPKVTVRKGDAVIPSGDYEIKYGSYMNLKGKQENTITVQPKSGNTVGTNNVNSFYIGTSLSGAKVSLQTSSITYEDSELDDYQIAVTLGGRILPPDCYEVSYQDNTAAGKASLIISGIKEKGYIGSVTKKFTISPKPFSGTDIQVEGLDSCVYNGKAQTLSGLIVKDGETTLEAGTDYTVKYSNNVKIGTATVTITGKKNYKGSIKETFLIEIPKL